MKKDTVEAGDFVSYQDHMMAVLDINEEYFYVFCNDDRVLRRFSINRLEKLKIEKKAGCKSIIRAFFDDMTYMR